MNRSVFSFIILGMRLPVTVPSTATRIPLSMLLPGGARQLLNCCAYPSHQPSCRTVALEKVGCWGCPVILRPRHSLSQGDSSVLVDHVTGISSA